MNQKYSDLVRMYHSFEIIFLRQELLFLPDLLKYMNFTLSKKHNHKNYEMK